MAHELNCAYRYLDAGGKTAQIAVEVTPEAAAALEKENIALDRAVAQVGERLLAKGPKGVSKKVRIQVEGAQVVYVDAARKKDRPLMKEGEWAPTAAWTPDVRTDFVTSTWNRLTSWCKGVQLKLTLTWAALRGKREAIADALVPLNFKLLQEVTGTCPEDGHLSMVRTLDYLSRQLDQESVITPEREQVGNRLKEAHAIAKKMDGLRKKSSKDQRSGVADLDKGLRNRLDQLQKEGGKVLVPLTYYEGEVQHDVLLEILVQKGSATCNMRMISVDEGVEGHFERRVDADSNVWKYLPVRDLADVPLEELQGRMKALLEMQLPSAITPAKPSMIGGVVQGVETYVTGGMPNIPLPTGREEFFEMLTTIPGAKEVPVDASGPLHRPLKGGGALQTMRLYLQTQRPQDAERLEFASQYRLFTDLATQTQSWLADAGYRRTMETAGRALLEQLHALGDRLAGDVPQPDKQGETIRGEVQAKIEFILKAIREYAPTKQTLRDKDLSTHAERSVEMPAIVKVPSIKGQRPEAPQSVLADAIPPFDLQNLDASFKAWTGICEKLRANKEYERLEQTVVHMASLLPNFNDPIWEGTEPKGAWCESLSNHVTSLALLLNEARSKQKYPSKEAALPPLPSMIAFATLQVLASQILQADPEWRLEERLYHNDARIEPFCLLGSQFLDKLSFNPHLTTCSTAERERLVALTQHMQFRKTEPSLIIVAGKPERSLSSFLKRYRRDRRTGDMLNQYEEFIQRKFPKNANAAYADKGDKGILPPVLGNVRKLLELSKAWHINPKKTLVERRHNEKAEKYPYTAIGTGKPIGKELDELSAGRSLHTQKQERDVLGGYRELGKRFLFEQDLCANPNSAFPQRDLEFVKKARAFLTDEEAIALFSCRVGNMGAAYDDNLEQTAHRTLINFFRHPNFFSSPDLQQIFMRNLFAHGFLHDSISPLRKLIEDHPDFAGVWLAKIKAQIQATEDTDSRAHIFLCRFAHHFGEQVQLALDHVNTTKVPEEIPMPAGWESSEKEYERTSNNKKRANLLALKEALPVVLSQLKELGPLESLQKFADNDSLTSETRRMAYLEIMGAYANRCPNLGIMSAEQLQNLLHMQVFCSQVQPSHLDENPVDAHRVQRMMEMLRPQMQKLLPIGGAQDQILGPVAARLIPGFKGSWKESPHFPMFEASHGGHLYHLNVIDGTLYTDNQAVGLLSTEVRADRNYKRLFGEANPSCHASRVVDKESGDRVSIYKPVNSPGTIIMERVPAVSVGDVEGHREVVILKSIEVRPGVKVSCQYVRFRSQDETDSPDLPDHIRAAIGDRDCWIDRKNPSRVYVLGPDNAVYATLKVSGSGKDAKVESFIRNGKELLDISGYPQLQQQFAALDDPRHILVFGHKGRADVIEYPRILRPNGEPMRYQIAPASKGSPEKLIPEGYPNHTLQAYGRRPHVGGQEIPGILPEGFTDFQLLQGKDGAQIVLIPMNPLGKVKGHISNIRTDDLTDMQQFYEYRVDPTTKRLVSSTIEGNLLLAHHFYAHQQYGDALEYLDKATTDLEFSSAHRKILNWMHEVVDDSPNGNAFRMHLELYKANNFGKREEALSESPSHRATRLGQLARHFKQYQDHLASPNKPSATLAPKDGQMQQIQAYLAQTVEWHVIKGLTTEASQPIASKAFVVDATQVARAVDTPTSFARKLWLDMRSTSAKTLSKVSAFFILNAQEYLVGDFKVLYEKLRTLPKDSAEYRLIARQVEMVKSHSLNGFGQMAKRYLQIVIRMRDKDETIPEFPAKFDRPWGPLSYLRRLKDLAPPLYKLLKHKMFGKADDPKPAAKAIADVEQMTTMFETLDEAATKNNWAAPLPAIPPAQSPDATRRVLTAVPADVPAFQGLSEVIADTVGKEDSQAASALVDSGRMAEWSAAQERTFLEKRIQQATTAIENAPAPAPIPVGAVRSPMPIVSANTRAAIEGAFHKTAAPAVAVTPEQVTEVFAPLRVGKDKENLALQREADEYIRDAQTHLEGASRTTQVTAIKAQLQQVIENLNNDKTNADNRRRNLESSILATANGAVVDSTSWLSKRLRKGPQLSMERLLGMCATGELAQVNRLRGEGPLSNAALSKLDRDLIEYQMLLTQSNQLQDDVNKVQAVMDHPEPTQDAVTDLYKSLKAPREYTITLTADSIDVANSDPHFREILALEAHHGFLIRGANLDLVKEMLTNPNAIRRLPMGAGKSLVASPLLARLMANGRNLVTMVLPDWMYANDTKNFDRISRRKFGQEVYGFHFDRSSDMSPLALTRLKCTLLCQIQNKGIVTTTKGSIIAVRHAMIDMMDQLRLASNRDKPKIAEQVKLLAEIWEIFSKRSDVLADEVHKILAITKEDNWAKGMAGGFSALRGRVGLDIFREVFKRNDLKLRHALLTQVEMSEDERRFELKIIAGAFYDKWNPPGISRDDFIAYVTEKRAVVEPGQSLPPFMRQLQQHQPERFAEIAVLTTFLFSALKHSLSLKANVDFIRDPEDPLSTIPASTGKAVQGSQQDDDSTRLCFLLQDFLCNGVTEKQMDTVVTEATQAAIQQRKAHRTQTGEKIPLSQTPQGLAFTKLVTDLGLPHLTLGSMGPSQIKQLTEGVRQSPEATLTFCEEWAIPHMSVTKEQIRGTPLDVVAGVNGFRGITGTDSAVESFHSKTSHERVWGERSLPDLLGTEVEVLDSVEIDPKDPLNSLLDNDKVGFLSNYNALIDVGAYLKGISSNEEFIDGVHKRILDAREAVKNKTATPEQEALARRELDTGIYVDAFDDICAKKAGEHESQLLKATKVDPKKAVTFYDQGHTTGLDVAQVDDAVAAVTIGETTDLDTFKQGLYRMRKFGSGQKVRILLNPGVTRLIRPDGGKPTRNDVIVFLTRNQSKRRTEDTYRSECARIAGAIPEAMVRQLAAGALTLDTNNMESIAHLEQLFAVHRPFLITSKKDDFVAEASISTAVDPQLHLQHLAAEEARNGREKCVAKLREQGLHQEAEQIEASITRDLDQRTYKDPSLMPKRVEAATVSTPKEVTVQKRQETHVELRVDVQADVEVAQAPQAPETVNRITMLDQDGVFDQALGISGRRAVNPYIKKPFTSLDVLTGVFDDNIIITHNLAPHIRDVVPGTSLEQTAPKLFYKGRIPANQALFVKHPGENWRVVMGDSVDSTQGYKSQTDHIKSYLPQSVAMLIDTTLPEGDPLVVESSHPNKLFFVQDEDRASFFRAYVQCKLFNGDVNYYNPEEIAALEAFLKEKGPEKFQEIFLTKILPSFPQKARAYASSPLKALFDRLIR